MTQTKEEALARRRARWHENKHKSKEAVAAQNKRYYAENRERLIARQRERYQENRVIIIARNKTERADPTHDRRKRERSAKLKAAFGISQIEFMERLVEQGGTCKICKRDPGVGKDGRLLLQVDHCHKTGKVRGILCPSCNSGLAKFKENPALLAEAIRYLDAGN